jgi:hypothetical protein
MRLYIKLVGLIALTIAANQYAVSSARRQAAWFTIRCAYAEAARDERLEERLVAEGQAYILAHGQWEGDENAPLYVERTYLAAGRGVVQDCDGGAEDFASIGGVCSAAR